MSPRSVAEWIGAGPDSRVPTRVKARIFEKYEGRCYLSGIKIRPGEKWDVEHIIALAAGGEHRESNMAPALAAAHKTKTAADRVTIAKINRNRLSHLGLKGRSKGRPIPGSKASGLKKKLDGTVVRREK